MEVRVGSEGLEGTKLSKHPKPSELISSFLELLTRTLTYSPSPKMVIGNIGNGNTNTLETLKQLHYLIVS